MVGAGKDSNRTEAGEAVKQMWIFFHGGVGYDYCHRKSRRQIKAWFSTRESKDAAAPSDEWENPNAAGLFPTINFVNTVQFDLQRAKRVWRDELKTGQCKRRGLLQPQRSKQRKKKLLW